MTSTDTAPRIAIIGAGPAGLMAADVLTTKGHAVDIYDAMPSPARKFLMAGKSGLNITHTEDLPDFLSRYTAPDTRLSQMVETLSPATIPEWMRGLGIEAVTGSTGRVFPSMMKASPLLRAWLARLAAAGATLHTRHRWTGWTDTGALNFDTPDGAIAVTPAATLFALGGASWKRLGSDGAWASEFASKDIPLTPFLASNCGFDVAWSDIMIDRFAGQPVKSITLRTTSNGEPIESRGEFVITMTGIEGGGIYALSGALREHIQRDGYADLTIDLLPDIYRNSLIARLSAPRGKQSLTNHLRKNARLSPVKIALLRECLDADIFNKPAELAAAIKALPLRLNGLSNIDNAISTTGGVSWDALDETLQLKSLPGHFCAGEMIDWDAPTGGYLITACLAMGQHTGKSISTYLSDSAEQV
ncbi:MAG: TIGR03862 family flavoprotein [Hyphomonas sp.]